MTEWNCSACTLVNRYTHTAADEEDTEALLAELMEGEQKMSREQALFELDRRRAEKAAREAAHGKVLHATAEESARRDQRILPLLPSEQARDHARAERGEDEEGDGLRRQREGLARARHLERSEAFNEARDEGVISERAS